MTEALLAFVANAAWQGGAVGATGLLLARVLRPARLRFQFLALTLVIAACAPLFTLLPRDARPADAAIAAPRVEPVAARVVAAIYLAGAAIAVLRLLRAAVKARRIAMSSMEMAHGARLSERIETPVTIGRTVYIPPSIAAEAPLLAAALAHERAHVRRNDYALHVMLECLALPLYFHPVILLLRRALAEAREIACDEEAAAECGTGAYAEALVRIASLAMSRRTTRRTAAVMNMAAAPIERRVAALVRGRRERSRRSMLPIALSLPLLTAIACSRVDVAPAIEQATLGGRWTLVREASDLRQVAPRGYDAFVQTIEQGPTRVAVRQRRVVGGRATNVAWSVITDGVMRPIGGHPAAKGSATWNDGRLTLQMSGPGTQRESAVAFIRDGRLIIDGQANRGRYHTEFERIDP